MLTLDNCTPDHFLPKFIFSRTCAQGSLHFTHSCFLIMVHLLGDEFRKIRSRVYEIILATNLLDLLLISLYFIRLKISYFIHIYTTLLPCDLYFLFSQNSHWHKGWNPRPNPSPMLRLMIRRVSQFNTFFFPFSLNISTTHLMSVMLFSHYTFTYAGFCI